MKEIILVLLMVLFFAGTADAEWYVISIDNEIIARCDYQPDQKDLDERGEIAIYSSKDIPFEEAEYRGGKIVKHVKTSKELEAEAEEAERTAEELLISEKSRKMAIEALEAEGVTFEHIK